ncbi:hypothetical protein E2C01_060608 [Portunus trituberculatus]|uniref:Uncharacterized protein n=1 Tax=Portunus trituberculatus TaxID=210409 RepID=A0A5B7H1N1_PORTR|nr:hypothetical protein [Portunus trituberculatus]
MADANLRILSSGAAARHEGPMVIANPTIINTAKGTKSTGNFLTCTADKTMGGDKRLATKHGSHMADAISWIGVWLSGMGAVRQTPTSVSWVMG